MKSKFSLLVVLAMVASLSSSFAHALWIETAPKGKKGQEQEVKIYYGEYLEGMIEKVDDWYSDVSKFELWLIDPEGNKTALTTQQGSEEYFTAKFTPSMDGVYRIQIGHSAKDLGGDYIYQFNTAAQVWVGKTSEIVQGPSTDLALLLTSPETGKLKDDLHFTTYFKGQPQGGIKVTITSPNGWTKEVESNEKGELTLETPWKGQYIVEAIATEETSGEHFGQQYNNIWRCATQSIIR
ncbi:hypothetical protein GCM10007049_27030 [Echinicola pacifica]|uniref:DUF4198 domain-containing protein n=1 Tax=Echinicola pacifica TaxID=346377 RepID=A0A918Q3E8_9BACT|nr:DUF4198 domain-containing protein [Echinicola pacifica]GGZ32210.1 hypothetical protein GCM10007049_27030 [Echinicola pacifica]